MIVFKSFVFPNLTYYRPVYDSLIYWNIFKLHFDCDSKHFQWKNNNAIQLETDSDTEMLLYQDFFFVCYDAGIHDELKRQVIQGLKLKRYIWNIQWSVVRT